MALMSSRSLMLFIFQVLGDSIGEMYEIQGPCQNGTCPSSFLQLKAVEKRSDYDTVFDDEEGEDEDEYEATPNKTEWSCFNSVYPGQKDCWAADVHQKCHQKREVENAQWAYDRVKGAGGNTEKAWKVYGDIMAGNCKKTEWGCFNSVYPGQKDCWAAEIFQVCHAKSNGGNAQWAYDLVNKPGGDTKKAWKVYGDIVADNCKNTEWGCFNSVYPGQKDCWAAEIFQVCHAINQGDNAQWAYNQVNKPGGNTEKALQEYQNIVEAKCVKER